MAVYSVDNVLEIIFGWEKELFDFYQILENKLNCEKSLDIVRVLKKEQDKAMYVLEALDISKYREVEYDKNLPNFNALQAFSTYEFNENVTPKEILEKVFDFEEMILTIYQQLKAIVVYEKSKEVFHMLSQFKLGQIKKLKSYLDEF